MDDFNATAAQIIVVLLLALVFESKYFELLTPGVLAGNRFWNRPMVRGYSLTIISFVIAVLGAAMAELAGFLHDTTLLRVTVFAAIVVALIALLSRMWIDILRQTR